MLENVDFDSSKMTGNAFINSKLNFYFQMFVLLLSDLEIHCRQLNGV